MRRSERDNRKSYTILDFYKPYLEYVDNDLYRVEYDKFHGILIDYFKYVRDEVIERGHIYKLPFVLGTLHIVKRKPKQWNGESLRMDYHASKEIGKMVYHLNEHSDGFKYRFHWCKIHLRPWQNIMYQLIMVRANKRRLAQIIKNRERDYIELD